MAEVSFPRNRRDFVHILKNNEFNIPEAVNEVIALLNIEEELTDSFTSYIILVQSNFKKAKKSLDQLNNEWWTSQIPCDAKPNMVLVKSSGPFGSLKTSTQSQTRKSLFSVFCSNKEPDYPSFWSISRRLLLLKFLVLL